MTNKGNLMFGLWIMVREGKIDIQVVSLREIMRRFAIALRS